jgi:enoyl-CoA hydratase/carnithine racemase
MIVDDLRLTARQAALLGLVDAAWPPQRFAGGVEQFLADRLAAAPLRRIRPGRGTRIHELTRLGRWRILQTARRQIGARGLHNPAPVAAWKAIRRGVTRTPAECLVEDRAAFADLLFHPVCRNLLAAFFQRKVHS